MTRDDTRRPGGVTFIGIVCGLIGVAEIILGALALILLPWGELTGPAILLVLLGIGYVVVALAILSGRDIARVAVLLISLIHAVNGLWLAVSGQLVYGLVTIAVAVLVVALLFTGRGARYFSARR